MNVQDVKAAWDEADHDPLDSRGWKDFPTDDIVAFTLKFTVEKLSEEMSKVMALADKTHLCRPEVYCALIHLRDAMGLKEGS